VFLEKLRSRIDIVLVSAIIPLVLAGLVTMYAFSEVSYYFDRQIIWILVALFIFFALSLIDWRFLRRSGVLIALYIFSVGLLVVLGLFGDELRGAQSWFLIGDISFQPADFMKLVLILVLAKYFSRRHVAIAHVKHIIISGTYALIPFVLILAQPDFGTAIIIFLIWLGMVLVSGVSKKHLLMVFVAVLVVSGLLWGYGFTDNQKARVITFVKPLEDLQGAGYNAFQSTIAVGSGGFIGRGVGYGTQSRLNFLPEYQTDFIFAAFAEEWGFIGVVLLFVLFGLVIARILMNAYRGETNFEVLFGLGLVIYLMSHFIVHVGMNIGLLPVTGLTMPFLSYGGSHLLIEFAGLGILMGMRRYANITSRETLEKGDVHDLYNL
jgi:rod shape determining protein RodA